VVKSLFVIRRWEKKKSSEKRKREERISREQQAERAILGV
jgi:hypothetical protein